MNTLEIRNDLIQWGGWDNPGSDGCSLQPLARRPEQELVESRRLYEEQDEWPDFPHLEDDGNGSQPSGPISAIRPDADHETGTPSTSGVHSGLNGLHVEQFVIHCLRLPALMKQVHDRLWILPRLCPPRSRHLSELLSAARDLVEDHGIDIMGAGWRNELESAVRAHHIEKPECEDDLFATLFEAPEGEGQSFFDKAFDPPADTLSVAFGTKLAEKVLERALLVSNLSTLVQRAERDDYDLEQIGYKLADMASRHTKSKQSGSGFKAEFIDNAELANNPVKLRWLVKRVMVAEQPLVIGGGKKVLKTTTMLDMAISLASGRPFLNVFDVPEPMRVMVLSGESGRKVIEMTQERICRERGIRLESNRIFYSFKLPWLTDHGDMAELARGIRECPHKAGLIKQIDGDGIKVVFIDPLYMCLLAGSEDLQASNLHHIGPLLLSVAQSCLEAGATPVLLHHTRKSNQINKTRDGEPLDLDDLAYAGIAEFARQWIMISRRNAFDPDTGASQLWLSVGGSAGHCGLYGVDVEEGVMGDDFGGRKWKVSVRTATEVLKGKKKDQEEKKKTKVVDQEMAARSQIIDALKTVQAGETQSEVARLTGFSRNKIGPVLNKMMTEGIVCRVHIKKPFGKTHKMETGWKLYHPPGVTYLNNPAVDEPLRKGVFLDDLQVEGESSAN